MCGFAGILNFRGERVKERVLSGMTNLISHRGPDGTDYYYKNNIGLGHQLLTITGSYQPTPQPLVDESGDYIIVFNGEIFNYKDLKKDLQNKGHCFKTPSDTEVVLKSYIEYGEKINDLFNGMWAFGIIDLKKNKLFISRDRYGIKPLYYTHFNKEFLFFSEIKQLKGLPDFPFKLNTAKTEIFLKYGELNSDEFTLFENVFALRPGECASVDLGSGDFKKREWYSLNNHKHLLNIDAVEASKEFANILGDSIKLRIPETVKCGAFLSGGVDSSTIIGMMHYKGMQEHIAQTISCVINHKDYNEEKYIDLFADHYKIRPSKIVPHLNRSITNYLDDCIYHQDQPITSTSHLMEWQLFAEVKRLRLSVILDGQGADEILGGYGLFYYNKFIQSFTIPKIFTYINEIKNRSSVYQTSLFSEIKNLVKHHPSFGKLGIANRKANEIQGWFSANKEIKQSNRYHGNCPDPDFLIRQISISLIERGLTYLLHSMDRNSMAFGIETRLPFLDHRLVEYSLSLPDNLKIDSLVSKKVLKDAARNIVPKEILSRKKMGFSTPDEVIIKDIPLSYWNMEEMYDRFPGMFHKKLKTDIIDFYKGKGSYNFGFFRVLSFSRWAKILNVHFFCLGFVINFF